MNRPVIDMTMMPIIEWMIDDTERPTRTDAREIGSERNLSTMPFSRSCDSPAATMNAANVMVCAMMPGSNHSRYEPPGALIAPPKT